MERETGVEPATSTLARSHSTTELLPLRGKHHYIVLKNQGQLFISLTLRKARVCSAHGVFFAPSSAVTWSRRRGSWLPWCDRRTARPGHGRAVCFRSYLCERAEEL